MDEGVRASDLIWRAERLLGWFRLVGGVVGFVVTFDDAGVAPGLNHTIDQAANIAIFATGLFVVTQLERFRDHERATSFLVVLFALDLLLLGAIKPINAHWEVVTPQPALLLPVVGAMRFGPVGAAVGSAGLVVSQAVFELLRANVYELPSDVDNSVILVMIAILGGFMVGRVVSDAQAALAAEEGRVRFEADLAARLQALDRRKNAFVNITSHELRTPVAVLLSGTRLLQRSRELSALEREQMLSAMRRSAERLAELAEELGLVASLDADKIVVTESVVDLLPMVVERAEGDTDVVTMDRPAWVRADRELMGHVLDALFSNARDHGAPPIQVWWEPDGDMLELHLQDGGRGVPVEHRMLVFERFNVADAMAHGRGGGLGLSIARGLAEIMEGGLDLLDDDAPGHGARGAHFRLRMPLAAQPAG